MAERIKQCDVVKSCVDCPRYGDDCDGDKRIEPTDAVTPSLADVYKWERDIALSQLEEYGIGFAEKKRDDLVEVVRCKDCQYRKKIGTSYYCELDEFNVKDADFCSWGERREE